VFHLFQAECQKLKQIVSIHTQNMESANGLDVLQLNEHVASLMVRIEDLEKELEMEKTKRIEAEKIANRLQSADSTQLLELNRKLEDEMNLLRRQSQEALSMIEMMGLGTIAPGAPPVIPRKKKKKWKKRSAEPATDTDVETVLPLISPPTAKKAKVSKGRRKVKVLPPKATQMWTTQPLFLEIVEDDIPVLGPEVRREGLDIFYANFIRFGHTFQPGDDVYVDIGESDVACAVLEEIVLHRDSDSVEAKLRWHWKYGDIPEDCEVCFSTVWEWCCCCCVCVVVVDLFALQNLTPKPSALSRTRELWGSGLTDANPLDTIVGLLQVKDLAKANVSEATKYMDGSTHHWFTRLFYNHQFNSIRKKDHINHS